MIASLRTALQFVHYPDSDGKPIAENTLQLRWIFTLYGNIAALFREAPDVFVAGDNLVYPVQGDSTITQAPDVCVRSVGRTTTVVATRCGRKETPSRRWCGRYSRQATPRWR